MPGKTFPISLNLQDRPVLVVGGGETAARKLRLLLGYGPRLTVVAPDAVLPEVADLAASGRIVLHTRPFAAVDAFGHAVVFSAAGEPVDAEVAAAARAANIPVNVVDRPDLSDFLMPAIVERGPVTVAISTDGTAPVLARLLREKIEALLPARLGDVAAFAARFRSAVKASLGDAAQRRRFWERFFDGPVAELVLAGALPEANRRMVSELGSGAAPKGAIYIVGAGPGDPDLLTFQATRLMQQADVVLHDDLLGPGIMDKVRRDAERIYVGKRAGHHAMSQDEINALMVREAKAGRRVLRLKGGDPFVFGRGAEEADYARARGVDVFTAPGLTAALGCAASAGIPLTHRDDASSVTFVTGHGKDGAPEADWKALVAQRQTIVVYMGLKQAGRIAAQLIGAGLYAGTPVAIVEDGTRPTQKVSTGILADLGPLAERHADGGPALLIIGDVVRHAKAWAPPELALTAAW